MSDDLLTALRAASTSVDVPGTPYALRLDHAAAVEGGLLLAWSYPDPETWEPDGGVDQARVHGWVLAEVPAGDVAAAARDCWARAQLDAAWVFVRRVDQDWVPGEPVVDRAWTVESAWEALLDHLGGRHRSGIEVDGHEIRVHRHGEVEVYRIDPAAWAVHISDRPDVETFDPDETPDPGDVVPANVPLDGGLPLWVTDELGEAMGAWGPVVGLVDGELVGLGDPAEWD